MSLPLAQARRVAGDLVDLLSPAAERIGVAGSVRREKPTVKDIEIVAIPRWREQPREGAQVGLGQAPPLERINLLQEAIEAEPQRIHVIKPGTHELIPWSLKPEGRYWRLWLPERQVKVDLFLATPERWGAVFTIRTGSWEFSRDLVQEWTRVSGGGHFDEGLVKRADGTVVPTPEERDVLAAVGWPWVEPRDRERAAVTRG